MSTHIQKAELYLMAQKGHNDDYIYSICQCDMSEYGYIPVAIKEFELSFDIPDDFDPVNGHIDALKAEKQKIAADAQVKMNNLEEQIQSLLCIEDKSGGR